MINIIWSIIIYGIFAYLIIYNSYFSEKTLIMKDEKQKDYIISRNKVKQIELQYFIAIGIFTAIFFALHFIF